MQLFDYQKVGRDFLAEREVAGLFDGMRLGKTRQALEAAKKVGAKTTGVVAKASGVYVWYEEAIEAGFNPVILKSKDEPQIGKFNIFSYNALSSKLLNKLLKIEFDLVIGDESDAFKNKDAKRTKAFYGPRIDRKNGLTSVSKRVWIMTGTPVPNNPSELWPALHALFPDAIALPNGYPMNYWQFVNRYCLTRENNFGTQIVGGKNLDQLRDQLRGRTLRRTKEQVWKDWQKTVIDVLPVEGKLENIPNDEIERVKKALENDGDIISALQSVAEQAPTLRKLTGLAKVNGVVEWVNDNIEQSGKIIIFAHHKEVIQNLQSKLNQKHKFVTIKGGMSSLEKKEAYTSFQENDDIKICIGQNQAARDSIPLWKSSTTVSVEPDWTPGNNDQMMDRMAYFDKKEPCVGYFCYATRKY
jgi:SWI/SNF-related matrix-associated actin-dependent regulator 1 of chromatin subfamily A